MTTNFQNDEQLVRFRAESDKAFLAMQTSADEEMTKFLKEYSDGGVLPSFRTPDMGWNTAPPLMVRKVTAAAKGKIKQVADKVENLTEKQVRQMGAGLKGSAQAHAHDAMSDAQGVLKQASMDLGERAKREATAMRDAARRAMSEETSLRGLAQRAKAELNAAKERITHELIDAGQDAMGGLEGVAVDKVGDLGAQGLEAAEAAGISELFGLEALQGKPPKKKLR